ALQLDQHDRALLAEATRELPRDRRVDQVLRASAPARLVRRSYRTEGHKPLTARAGEDLGELLLGEDAGAKQRVRERLPLLAGAVDVLHLLGREEVLRDDELGELRLGRDGVTVAARRTLRSQARSRADHAHDLLWRDVLRDVRDRAGREREIADGWIEREE